VKCDREGVGEEVDVENAENGDEGVGGGSPFSIPLESMARVFMLKLMVHVAYSWREELGEMEADVESQQTQGYGEGDGGIYKHLFGVRGV
jgi:hypothetical protein